MSVLRLKKSTIVRTRTQALRLGFRTAEVAAPSLGARVATRLWFTIPPTPRVAALPTGGSSFEVVAQGSVVRGGSYGAGPVVYLMHGWGGVGAQLGSFIEPLRSNGFRVVVFDAPAHGSSDPGPSGPGRSHGLEFSRALAAVADRFGPTHAVIAHSMGAVPALLAQVHEGLVAERLVFLSPMRDLATYFDRFAGQLGIGRRIRAQMTVHTERLVDYPVAGVDVRVLSRRVEPVPLLIVHDRRDRETSYDDSGELAQTWAGPARLISTDGLGHRRILSDQQVVDEVVRFVSADVLEDARSA